MMVRGAFLWPAHLPNGFDIPSADARLFGLWCQRIDEPTRFQDFRFDLARAIMTFTICRMVARALGAVSWHISDLWDRLHPDHK